MTFHERTRTLKEKIIGARSSDVDISIFAICVIIESGYRHPVIARRRKIVVYDDTARRSKSTIGVLDRETKHKRSTYGQLRQIVIYICKRFVGLVECGID